MAIKGNPAKSNLSDFSFGKKSLSHKTTSAIGITAKSACDMICKNYTNTNIVFKIVIMETDCIKVPM